MLLGEKRLAARLEAVEASVQRLEVLWNTGQLENLSHAVLPATKIVLKTARDSLQREGEQCTASDTTRRRSSCDSQSNASPEPATLQQQSESPVANRQVCAAHELLQYSATVLHTMLQDSPYNMSGAAWAVTDFLHMHENLTDIVLCGRVALTLLVSAQDAWRVLCEAFALPGMRGAQDFLSWYKEQLRPLQITCNNEGCVHIVSNLPDETEQQPKPLMRRPFGTKVAPVPVREHGALNRDSFRIAGPHQVQPKLAVNTYLQWEGRAALQSCWLTLLVLRGIYSTIPSQVHHQLFTSPFLKCFANALDSALANPTHSLPAFIPEVSSDIKQREFLRLYRHNGEAGCSSERSSADDARSLDSEASRRASRVHELIQATVSGAVERALNESRSSTVWTRRVEVDVWPKEPHQPLSVQRLFGSSDPRLFGRPRQLLSTHYQAIMVLADFIDRMIRLPRFVQRLLIPVCITEARHLMGILQDLSKWCSSSHGSRPLMALSALLCLRRRIRSMVLSQQMMHMTWRAGGDECGHLGQTAHMLRSLDRIIYTSEELLTRRLVAIIDDTVARAYHDISWTRLQWAVTGCLPSAPLMHLRCVLHSLLQGLIQTLSVAMAESVLSGVVASVADTLSELLIAKPLTLAWRRQKVHDAYHFCSTMWWLSQPHVVRDQHQDAKHGLHLCDSHLGRTCWRLAFKVTLQACSATDFASLAMTPGFWEGDVCAATLKGGVNSDVDNPGWTWFREQRVYNLDLVAPGPAFHHPHCEEGCGVEDAWPGLSKRLMDAATPFDLVCALSTRPELQQIDPGHMEEDSVQVIRKLANTWPAFLTSNKDHVVRQLLA